METFISLISGLAAIIGAIYAFSNWLRNNNKSISLFINSYKYNFFYPQSLIKQMIGRETNQRLANSDFIDYSLALRNGYYSNDITELNIRINDKLQKIEIPYKVLFNYIEDDKPRLKIMEKVLNEYVMPQDMKELTQGNLDEFIKRKPNTFDGNTMRIVGIYDTCNGEYECKLEKATYFDQIRTNLTIDLPISHANEDTIRVLDISEDKKLKPFSESILANTIGVSAVWYISCDSRPKHDKKHFFLKLKRNETGVYYDLLSTIGGVVEPPVEGIFNENTLEEYVRKEILREFYEETGYDEYMKDKGYNEDIINIKLLAFARDLTRGGKPQFFFAINTPEISNADAKRYFKKSCNGRKEFNSSVFTNASMYKLSPETSVNILYTFSYIQKKHKLPYIDLDI